MIKHMFAHAVLLSIAVCSFAQRAYSQPPSGDDPFAGSPIPGSDLFGEPSKKPYAGAGEEFTLDGVSLTASRVRSFTVSVSTLQIQPFNQEGAGGMGDSAAGMMSGYGNGGDMGGMEGGMGGFMGGGMGGMGGIGGGKGGGMGGIGASGGGMMGMGGMAGGMGMGSSTSGMSDLRVVIAFIMDNEQIAGRTRIEVLVPQGPQGNYVRLEALPAARSSKSKTEKKASPVWSPATAKLIKDTISLKIWKDDAIKTLQAEEGKGEQAAASEKLLKAVLSEEYDAQLARQQFELARLQERLKRIQEEFTRRQQAKDRVIDVQLGKIILEAQGIIGANQ